MSVRHFDSLFHPSSIAVIGASARPQSVGQVVMRNLLGGRFQGPILPVNPKYGSVEGVLCYPDVKALPMVPDLAVIATPAASVPELMDSLGRAGTRAAIVLSAGFDASAPDGKPLRQAVLDAARPYLLRILGPNCLGMLSTPGGINASFAHMAAMPGSIALVSQSGALCTAVLDWAAARGIGFSHFLSLGDALDIDFGDLLDYLAADAATRAILLYVESIGDARKFISAARAAANLKPIIAVKSGRVPAAEKAAASHTGALAGGDAAYSAAFHRAGILRVDRIESLFDAVETLARAAAFPGERLAILTNGGGPGVMAVDSLVAAKGTLATLAEATQAKLNAVLPANWSHGNPIDIIGDATPERYTQAMQIALEDPGIDALLVMHAPTAVTSSLETAKSVAGLASQRSDPTSRTILTCWLGGQTVGPARQIFAQCGIASYETPEAAVTAFMHPINHQKGQDALREMPSAQLPEISADLKRVRDLFALLRKEGRQMLTEWEAKEVLKAYGFPVVETAKAQNVEEALAIAWRIGYPVVAKILSKDISHKSDVGGVALNLESPEDLRQALSAMEGRVARLRPGAALEGFTIQEMVRRPRAYELILGMTEDTIFGPILLFGAGGTATEIMRDRAVALPPLNANLADAMMRETKIYPLLKGYRDHPAADLEAIRLALLRLSQMTVDLAEIAELDINPLLADDRGTLVLDARIRLHPADRIAKKPRLAISPYPKELEEKRQLSSGLTIVMRPIRPEDEAAHMRFFSRLSEEDRRYRFFGQILKMPHQKMVRYTQIDYDREMAFIAVLQDAPPEFRNYLGETVGVARALIDPDNIDCEFAISVQSDLKSHGIGRALMETLIGYYRKKGTSTMTGFILQDNRLMLDFAKELDFELKVADDNMVKARLSLA